MNNPINISLHTNLRLSNFIRCVVIVVASIIVLFTHTTNDVKQILITTLALMTIAAAGTFFRLHTRSIIHENEFLIQLVLDTVLLTLLFGFSGGASNPFVSFYLFPVIISASTLSSRSTTIVLLVTLAAYSGLFFWEDAVSLFINAPAHSHHNHTDLMPDPLPHEASIFAQHLLGMWINFAISALLISTVIVKMRKRILEQREKINEQREATLRDEQILAIATQAANTAHHLGTPLSTMAVILNDLKQEHTATHLSEDLELLYKQIELCKQTLRKLRSYSDKLAQESHQPTTVNEFMNSILDEMHLLHPTAEIVLNYDNYADKAFLNSNYNLKLAMLNIFNNACEASKEPLEVDINCENSRIVINIKDLGPGLPIDIEGTPDTPYTSEKKSGLGLGLFLSHATLNRFEGTIKLRNNQNGIGTHTEVTLPLTTLIPDQSS